MPLKYAKGEAYWVAANAAGTQVVQITGLPFRPKAFRFITNGIYTAATAWTNASHMRRNIGYACEGPNGMIKQRCFSTMDGDVGTARGFTRSSLNDCIAATLLNTPERTGAVYLSAIANDGFTLSVLIMQPAGKQPANLTILYECWGDDVDEFKADIVDIIEPTADAQTTNHALTFQPDMFMA